MANRIIDDEFCAEIVETDISDLCRICGSPSDSPLVPIYEGNGLVQELASKIMQHLPIKISQEDILPVKSCISCTNVILTWHLLYECCVDADRRFQTILADEQIDSVLEKDIAKIKHSEEGSKDDKVQNTSHHEMEDVMFLQAEFGPEDEQYLDDDVAGTPDEDDDKGDDKKNVEHRIFKSRQQHQCIFCKAVYKSKELLTDHLKGTHYDLIFHCDICNEYKDQKDLIAHMTGHALSALQPEPKTTPPKSKPIQTSPNQIKCKKCDKIFTSVSGLRYHMNAVHEKLKNLKCDKCPKVFSCKRVLDNHIKSIHVKKKLFQCDSCDKTFKTDAALYSHKKTHANVFPYECDQCGKTFRFKHHHVAHVEIHNIVRKFACNICGKQFFAQNNLSKHLKTHADSLEFTCHICDVKMKQRRYLYEHMKRAHQPVNKSSTYSPICNILTHICPTCNEPVDNIEENVNINLLNSRLDCKPRYGECYECITHSKTVSGPRNKQKKHGKQLYKCNLCTKCFKSEKSYKAHKASDDCNTLLYMCPICNCSSDRKLNLQIHLQSHTKDNPCRICCSSFNTTLMLENHKASHAKSDLTKYDDFSTQITCNDCKERFYSKFDLYFHTITNHNSEDEKFSCLLCKRVFESVTMLRHHSKVHEEKETFQCHECGKTFKKLKNFEEHKNVHLNSRPFQCSVCLQTFKYSSNLSQHRAIHKEVRSFACSYCDKKFTRSNNLNMHLKTHRNERNYSCDLCSSSFVQSSSLHKHIRALHRKCDKCGVIVGDRKQWQIHLWKECKEASEFVTKV